MKRHNIRALFFLVACSVFTEIIFTTALCQAAALGPHEQDLYMEQGISELESIPLSSQMGMKLVEMAQNGTVSLSDIEIEDLFLHVNNRGDENNPFYALLRMEVDLIHKNTGLILRQGEIAKGSGTILYRANDHILILTAYHNLYQAHLGRELKTVQMSILEDNKDQKHPNSVLAEMIGGNYIQVGQKDIALVAMELKNVNNFLKNNQATYGILNFNNTRPPGPNNSEQAQINQYPAFFDAYIKTNGTAYHVNGAGYHDIPTLPGASGAAVIANDKIIGVHVSSGVEAPSNIKNIRYDGRKLLVKNNIFELIALDDIERESAKLRNNNNKPILAELIQKYINTINEQKRSELIEYLQHGRKAKHDQDTDPEFLKAINKLNEEKKFWCSWIFWPKKIEKITDEVVMAYNNAKTEL